MATVSNVVLKYAANGAQRVQRADSNVRDSIKRTAKTAQKESGKINRWMKANRTALMGIGAAAAGAMAAIIKKSPALSAQLASVRLGFSLLSMQIGEDVAPVTRGLGDAIIGLSDKYSQLSDSVRKPISAFVSLIAIGGAVLGVIAGLQTLISGTVVASFLTWAASALSLSGILSTLAYGAGVLFGIVEMLVGGFVGLVAGSVAAAAALGALLGLFGVWIMEVTGVNKAIRGLGQTVAKGLPAWARDGLLAVTSIFAGGFALLGAIVLGFVQDGLKGSLERGREVIDTFAGAWDRTIDRAIAGTKRMYSGVVGWVDTTASDVEDRLTSLTSSAKGWGRDLMSNFADGIVSKARSVKDRVEGIMSSIKSTISFDRVSNDRMAQRWGSDMIQHFAKGMQREQTTLRRATPQPLAGGSAPSQPPTQPPATSSGGQSITVVVEQGAVQQQGAATGGMNAEKAADGIAGEIGDIFTGRGG